MDIDRRSDHHILFKGFELNLLTRELYRHGLKVRLHGQPVEVLSILVACPGELVTRETLRKALWPKDTFVDFEHSLNSTINRLRDALGDDADRPRFIETIPRLGYRFIAPISTATSFGSSTSSKPQETVTALVEETAVPRQLVDRSGIQVETRIRLAVLPFTNLGDEPQDHLSDGLSTQMIVELGRVYKKLNVIGPVSSLYFIGTIPSFPRIARELGANYLLIGTVWRVPPRLRVFAQLIRAEDQCSVWSESYTRQDTDILAILDLITRDISRGLAQALPKPGVTGAYLETTSGTYEKYLRARFYSFKFDRSSFEKAVSLFEQVICENPNFAPAHATLALMLTAAMTFGGLPPQLFYKRVEQHLSKALDLEEENAEAQAALGYLRTAQADWPSAESGFLRALDINPSLSGAHIGCSQLFSALGRDEEAIRTGRRACELEPLSPIMHTVLGFSQYRAGQLPEAVESIERAIEIEPGFGPANVTLGFVYETMGEEDKALRVTRNAVEHAQDTPLMQCALARSLAIAGRTDEAVHLLGEILQVRRTNCLPATWIALIYAALWDQEQAWAWLKTAMHEQDPWRVFLRADPRFKFFAGDARFPELLKQIGLTPRQ
ncbi:MAG: winged helix-turn-helix domain-containing protein [Terracidiphilus sp.]